MTERYGRRCPPPSRDQVADDRNREVEGGGGGSRADRRDADHPGEERAQAPTATIPPGSCPLNRTRPK